MRLSDASTLPDQPKTIKRGGGRVWVHAATVKGRFARLRNVVAAILTAIFFAAPWVTIGGEPLIRLSFLSPSFVLFGRHLLIYEFYHFALLAFLLVLTLVLASAAFGRIWCGYACPQTVFVEHIFGRIETFFEGPAATRIVNQGKPLTVSRVLRKVGKQATYVLVCLAFAFTLVALFTGAGTILGASGASARTAVGLLTALAWFDGAYWREQFCHIVCPYGRLQNVMQDRATITIGYDEARGEPRRRGKTRDDAGDCIDCARCVRVCPSGIDIRQGASQQECIGCTRCIDACDAIMLNLGKPRGLIRYDAVASFAAPQAAHAADASNAAQTARPKFVRPRLIVLSVAWVAIAAVGVWQFINRDAFHALLLSTPSGVPYFVEGSRVKNLLTLKLGNQGIGPESFVISVDNDFKIESPTSIGPIAPGAEATVPVLVSAPSSMTGKAYVVSIKSAHDGPVQRIDRRLVGPGDAAQRPSD